MKTLFTMAKSLSAPFRSQSAMVPRRRPKRLIGSPSRFATVWGAKIINSSPRTTPTRRISVRPSRGMVSI
jgi:hypothetical protein